MLNQILTDLNAGWWKYSPRNVHFIFSDFVKDTLKLGSTVLPPNDVIQMVRKDYQEAMWQNNKYLMAPERIFPMMYQGEEIWVRSRYLGKQKEGTDEDIYYGYFQFIPNPEILSPDRAASLRLNNLMSQLNSISQILLTFLKADNPGLIINQILGDILKQFAAGRAYIIEYNWNGGTQSCTYEVVDENVAPEMNLLTNIPINLSSWWTQQLLAGNPIALSSLDQLPEEATEMRNLLEEQDIKSLIVVPLTSRNGVWGYIGIDIVDNFYYWTEDDRLWFNSLANIISLFLELNHSEALALRDKARLQRLYQNMPMAYMRMRIIFDENGTPVDYMPVEANKAATELFQTPLEDLIGVLGSTSRDDFSLELDNMMHILSTDEHVETQLWISEIQRYCNQITYGIGSDQIVCLITDITESHTMHEELDRNEKILRNIYDNMPVGIELYDKEGRLLDMNIGDMKMFGLSKKEDALGVSIFDNPNIPHDAKVKLRNRQPASFHINYAFEQVTDFYTTSRRDVLEMYCKADVLYDSKGNPSNYLFINIDNTEISEAYKRIGEFESSFLLISQFGKIGYCKFDLNTRQGGGVAQWYRNLGEEPDTPLDQIIGIYQYANRKDRQKIFAHIARVKAGECNGFTEEVRILHKDGVWRWTRLNVLKNPTNKNPQKLEMLCVNFDITDQKETERKLIEAKQKAEVSDKLKSAFVANMSHEIRTPLNAIVGFSSILAEAEDAEERSSYIEIIQKNNDMLLQLISDILDLSKIEAGTFDFAYSYIDPADICRETLKNFEVKMQGNPVKLLMETAPMPCRLHSDRNRLLQVIGNFVNNAIKFTTEGSITVGAKPTEDDKIMYYVRDTGCGIPQEEQKNVFQRFVKLNHFVQGTGLGLSICSSIIEQLGGEIGLDSQPGQGSCFWFTVPYARPAERETT